jgi:hypothetical protein
MTDRQLNVDLRALVAAELATADPGRPDLGEPTSWLIDPADADRTATGLHSLLAAIQSLGDEPALTLSPVTDAG